MRSLPLTLAIAMLAACSDGQDDTGGTSDGGSSDGGASADADGDGTPDADDCAPEDAEIHPGATEFCDTVDNDCDGEVDEADAEDATTWYLDTDADGYGDPDDVGTAACANPGGYSADNTDCDDSIGTVHPNATETCNATDDDCDGEVDEEAADGVTSYVDADGDGFGDPTTEAEVCEGTAGYATNALDCDDTDADVNPGMVEICDGIDQDCGGDGDVGAVSIGDKGYGSIQAALDAAVDDDTLTICPGTYVENLKVLTTVAMVAFDAESDTIIDGGAKGPVISLQGADLSMTGLTLTNGKGGSAGGGIDGSAHDGGDVTLDHCVITKNKATSGAGVFMGTGVLTATDTEFTSNAATSRGGALYVPDTASAELSACTLSSNSASNGGGIDAEGALTLEDCTVDTNSATSTGGGIRAQGGLTITGATVISNNSASMGGGVYAADCDVVMDEAASIETNSASSEGGGAYLLASDGETATWTGGTLSENSSTSLGGGMVVQVETDPLTALEESATVTGVTVDSNEGTWSGGGFWLAGTTVELIDSVATYNISTYGGGASINETDGIYLEGVTITDNEASAGGGAFDVYLGPGTVTSCVIERNVSFTSTGADGLGGAVYIPTKAYLTSDDTDWGEDTDDNEPEDIFMDFKTGTSYDYGAGESFYCDGDRGTCE